MSNNKLSRLPAYFISHGGGPWPWMKQEMGTTYDKLAAAHRDSRDFEELPPSLALAA